MPNTTLAANTRTRFKRSQSTAGPVTTSARKPLPPKDSAQYRSIFQSAKLRSWAIEKIASGEYELEDAVQAYYFDRLLEARGCTPQDFGFADPPLTPVPDIAWANQPTSVN